MFSSLVTSKYFVVEADGSLPEWAKIYLKENQIDPNVVVKQRSNFEGKAYRGITIGGLNQLFREFSSIPKVGDVHKAKAVGLFQAMTKDKSIAESHAKKTISGRLNEGYEIPIVYEAHITRGQCFVDFEEYEDYRYLKYNKEREILVSPDVLLKIISIEYPEKNLAMSLLDPDKAWLHPNIEKDVERFAERQISSVDNAKRYLDFVKKELL